MAKKRKEKLALERFLNWKLASKRMEGEIEGDSVQGEAIKYRLLNDLFVPFLRGQKGMVLIFFQTHERSLGCKNVHVFFLFLLLS